MSSNPNPVINFGNVVVDHSETVVYKQEEKKTFVPEFAKQKLKSSAGGNTRTFKGATTVTVSNSGPVIKPAPTSIKPTSSGPQISITSASGTTAPKRIPQPQAAAAAPPVPYVPETRLYKKKLDDRSYIKDQQKEPEKESEPTLKQIAQAPGQKPVATPAPSPQPPALAPHPTTTPPPVPPAAAPSVASAQSIPATVHPPQATVETTPPPATGLSLEKMTPAPETGGQTTTTVTTTTTTVEQKSCCVVL